MNGVAFPFMCVELVQGANSGQKVRCLGSASAPAPQCMGDYGVSVHIMWTEIMIFRPSGKVQCNAESTFIDSLPQPTACQRPGGARWEEGHITMCPLIGLSCIQLVPHLASRCIRF